MYFKMFRERDEEVYYSHYADDCRLYFFILFYFLKKDESFIDRFASIAMTFALVSGAVQQTSSWENKGGMDADVARRLSTRICLGIVVKSAELGCSGL